MACFHDTSFGEHHDLSQVGGWPVRCLVGVDADCGTLFHKGSRWLSVNVFPSSVLLLETKGS